MTKNLFSAILSLVFIWYLVDKIHYRMQERGQEIKFHPEQLLPEKMPEDESRTELIPGGIILKADRQGHFRGTALINNVPMPFTIDTGATYTTVPSVLANNANLPIGEISQTRTANGLTQELVTQIDSLKLGNAEIKNIRANVNYKLEEVLIGMNTLKLFSMSVQDNTMTLIAANNPVEIGLIADDLAENKTELPPKKQPYKTVKKWKKNVVCNHDGTVCKTSYSQE